MTQALQQDAPLMQVEDLAVTFYSPNGTFRAVRDASLEIARGEVLGFGRRVRLWQVDRRVRDDGLPAGDGGG